MSTNDPAPPVSAAELIERVAMDLWASRDERRWEEAGDWQRRFRQLAETAIDSLRRHERRGDAPG